MPKMSDDDFRATRERLEAARRADRIAEQERRAPFVKECTHRFREGKLPNEYVPLDIVMEGWFVALQEQRKEIKALQIAMGRIEKRLGMEE